MNSTISTNHFKRCGHDIARNPLINCYVYILALEYVGSGEFPELLKIRIEMLLDDNAPDLALNLSIWCLAHDSLFYDPFIRAVQLMLFHSKGLIDQFYEQVRLLYRFDGYNRHILIIEKQENLKCPQYLKSEDSTFV